MGTRSLLVLNSTRLFSLRQYLEDDIERERRTQQGLDDCLKNFVLSSAANIDLRLRMANSCCKNLHYFNFVDFLALNRQSISMVEAWRV